MSGPNSTTARVFREIAFRRRSADRFAPDKAIPSSTLRDIFETTFRAAPSSFNLQPTNVCVVESFSLKHRLADTCMIGPGNQYRTRDCSVLTVFLSDLEASKRIDRVAQLEANHRSPVYRATFPTTAQFSIPAGHAATFLQRTALHVASTWTPTPELAADDLSYNTFLAVQAYLLAATSHGLATHVMEGLDGRRMRRLLAVPDRYAVPVVVATGYPYDPTAVDKESNLAPRLPTSEVVFGERFGESWTGNSPVHSENEESESA